MVDSVQPRVVPAGQALRTACTTCELAAALLVSYLVSLVTAATAVSPVRSAQAPQSSSKLWRTPTLRWHPRAGCASGRRILRGAFTEHGHREVDSQGDAFSVARPQMNTMRCDFASAFGDAYVFVNHLSRFFVGAESHAPIMPQMIVRRPLSKIRIDRPARV